MSRGSVTTDTATRRGGMRLAAAVLAGLAMLIVGYAGIQWSRISQAKASEPVVTTSSSTTTSSTTTTSTSTTTSTTTTLPPAQPGSPPAQEAPRYIVPLTEAEPEAKQLAADIAYSLTTYEAFDDHLARLSAIAPLSGLDLLSQANEPLMYVGSWSQGHVIYPQLGGLTEDRASVMVVTRQTVGSGGEVDFSLVRTLDIRLVRGESGWEFESLSSAGGTFERLADLHLAHEVARDPRIQMPDSARIDILAGRVSPALLQIMGEIADQTTYSVTVLATGHPENVFETERQSDHTVGLAVDIERVGSRRVIDDRSLDSATYRLADWLLNHPDVRQVGSPWDLDEAERRSFTDEVHQDHLHVAVNP